MTRRLATTLLVAAFFLPTLAGAHDQSVSVLVPAGTPVAVHVVGDVSSGKAKEGDTFPIVVANDVVVNGMVVAHAGAGGEGSIKAVDQAGGNGHSGSLGISIDYIYSADGGRIALSQATQTQSEDDRKGASSTATIIGVATFGLGGLFGHNLAHGRNKVITPKTILATFTAQTVHVQTSDHAGTVAAPGYDH